MVDSIPSLHIGVVVLLELPKSLIGEKSLPIEMAVIIVSISLHYCVLKEESLL